MSKLQRDLRLSVLVSSVVQNRSCTRCELHKFTTNVCIRGDGNPLAPIVILGEAPGEAEAEFGKPFCGKSGKWMRARLEELGLDKFVFITNSVRCRPPDNRKPTPTEMAACKQYLKRELEVIKPTVIVAVGRVALAQLALNMPRHTLKPSRSWEAMVMFTWHPAYVSRMGERSTATREFINDFQTVKDYLYQNVIGTVKQGNPS